MYVDHYSHKSCCCRRSVTPWITVLSQHTVFTKRVIYKFTFVWYSVKQGAAHRPMSHLVHLYTVPFRWPWEDHRRQHSWVDDFAGQCLLWRLSSHKTFFCTCTWSPNQWGGGGWGVSLSTWFQIRVSNQNFTNAFLLEFDFFPGHCLDPYNSVPYLPSFVWLGTVAIT